MDFCRFCSRYHFFHSRIFFSIGDIFKNRPENIIYATEIEAIENIENSETESAEPIFYPITDEQINIAITEFFKQKNVAR